MNEPKDELSAKAAAANGEAARSTIAKYAYDAALRNVEVQREQLDAIRGRSLALMAVGGTVLSFLSATVLRDPPDNREVLFYFFMIVATAGFLGMTGLTFWVHQPVNLKVAEDPTVMLDKYDGFSDVEAHRWLATNLDEAAVENATILQPRLTAVRWSSFSLGAEIVAVVVTSWLFL